MGDPHCQKSIVSRFLPDPPLLVEISRRAVCVSAPGGVPLVVALASSNASGGSTPFSWEEACAAIEQSVRKLRPKRAVLSIVLGDTWMRYFVIDWPQQRLSAVEEEAFAEQAFVRLYEQPVAEWLLTTIATGLPGKRLLCGMQRSAVAALDSLLLRCNWRADRLTGAFATGFDLAAPALSGLNGYFVYSHDGIAHCARLEAGALAAVRSQAMADGTALARAALARRFAAVASAEGTSPSPATVFQSLLVDCPDGDFPQAAGRNLRRELLAAGKPRNQFLKQIGAQWLAA